MLAVVDYGAGNLRSVVHALRHLGVENMCIVRAPQELDGADQIILPGVGAFGAGMQQLQAQALVQPLKNAIASGIPFLGICVGMQFLFERSDEMGDHKGLGVIPGCVTRFPENPAYKVPHMGWNQLQAQRPSPLLENVAKNSYVYFVHGYYCIPTNEADILATVDYGFPFAAAIEHENVYGVQFHPEKSQRDGLQILRNFLEIPS